MPACGLLPARVLEQRTSASDKDDVAHSQPEVARPLRQARDVVEVEASLPEVVQNIAEDFPSVVVHLEKLHFGENDLDLLQQCRSAPRRALASQAVKRSPMLLPGGRTGKTRIQPLGTRD